MSWHNENGIALVATFTEKVHQNFRRLHATRCYWRSRTKTATPHTLGELLWDFTQQWIQASTHLWHIGNVSYFKYWNPQNENDHKTAETHTMCLCKFRFSLIQHNFQRNEDMILHDKWEQRTGQIASIELVCTVGVEIRLKVIWKHTLLSASCHYPFALRLP